MKGIYSIIVVLLLPITTSAGNDTVLNIEKLKGEGYSLEYVDASEMPPKASKSSDIELTEEKNDNDVIKNHEKQKGKKQKKRKNKNKQNNVAPQKTIVDDTQPDKLGKNGKKVSYFIFGAIALALMYLIYKIYRFRRCPDCHGWNQLRLVEKEIVDEKPTSVTEERQMKNSKGEVIRTYEVEVPATRYEILKTYRCKNCGSEFETTSYKVVKN